MQPAVGPSKQMTGIRMGTETVDQYAKHHVLVVSDVSVFDPSMSNSLISAGGLMGADTMLFFASHPMQQAMASFLKNSHYMPVGEA